MSNRQRLPVLDLLRGVASFAVCWFHLTNGHVGFLPPGILKASGAYGWLGVEVFFVISGFVIPFALQRSDYQLADCGIFVFKRIARLDPPYFAAILLIVFLQYASSKAPGFQGEPFTFSLAQTLLHVGYLNAFFGFPWLNPVFWTLALEFQYYLLMAFIFPLIASRASSIRWCMMLALGILAFVIPAERFVFHWLPLFLLGITTFQFKTGIIQRKAYFPVIILISCGAWFCYGLIVTLVGVTSAFIIAFARLPHAGPLAFLGTISYSLYLLHVPIGGRVINLSTRFVAGLPGRSMIVFVAAAVTVLAAWALYAFVERPAQRWSAAIGYPKRQVAPSGFAPRAG